MRRTLPILLTALVWPMGHTSTVDAQPVILINTTAYVHPVQSFHCIAATEPCALNAAVDRGQGGGGGTISACFEPDNPRCLQTDDEHYDEATGRWHLQVRDPFSAFIVDRDDMTIDFTLNIPDWSGPQDNKIVVELATRQSTAPPNDLFLVSGSGNQFAGFEFKGRVATTVFAVRGSVVSDNIFGPGLIFAGMSEAVAIRLRGAGVSENRIIGNWCGVRGDGTVVDGLGEQCVQIIDGANNNVIGGSDPADRNVFAGNDGPAIEISDAATRDNVIQGNYIGLDATGLTAAPNDTGITLGREATGTRIIGNVISGNSVNGIVADRTSTEFGRIFTRIEDNYIGPNATGTRGPGNGLCGISIRNLSKYVLVTNNRIWYNGACGIEVIGENARDNTISQNSITLNNGRPIVMGQGANDGVRPPSITVAEPDRVGGLACPLCTVEVFSDPLQEAQSHEGTVEADAGGQWTLVKPTGFEYLFVAATATDGRSTSALSPAVRIDRVNLATRTPTTSPGTPPATPTPATSPTPSRDIVVHLPWAAKSHQLR